MAAPVWRTKSENTGSSTGESIPTPSGTVTGDFLLLHISFEGGTNITVTHSAFTLWDREDNSSNIGHVIAYREHDGTSLGSFSLNSSQKWSYTISRIDGQDPDVAVAAHKVAGANGSSGNPNPPSVTTTIDESLVFAIVANKKGATYTAPSGYTERWDNPNTSGGLPSNWGGSKTKSPAGAEDPGTPTASETETWVAGTVAIAPLVDAGGDRSINVSDSISVTESRKQERESFINKSEAVSVTENVNLTLVNDVTASDSVGVAESIDPELQSHVNKSEAVSVAESRTLLIPELFVTQSETIGVAESLKPELNSFINRSEAVAVTEDAVVTIEADLVDREINKSESISVSEAPNVSLTFNVHVEPGIQDVPGPKVWE